MLNTISKGVRVFDGVTDPTGGSENSLLSPHNGINKIAEVRSKNNWLPSVDAFRTFVVCPPPEVRVAFGQIRYLAAA